MGFVVLCLVASCAFLGTEGLTPVRAPPPLGHRWSQEQLACVWNHNTKEIKRIQNIEDCKVACEVETSFVCRSIDYVPGVRCVLSIADSTSGSYQQPCSSPWEKTIFTEIITDTCDLSHQWQCAWGQCIPRVGRCDGDNEDDYYGTPGCADGSDEEDCSSNICYEDEWRCSSGQCIDRRGRCDGRSDGEGVCSDGSDEKNCVPPVGLIAPDPDNTIRMMGNLGFDLFYSSQYQLTWYDALRQCTAESAQLATFSDDKGEDQYKEVLSYLSDNYVGEEFWIGYTDLDKEGEWSGVDRSTSCIRRAGSQWPWSGTTNTTEYEKNYMVVNSEGHFSDDNYDTKKKYICKKDSWRSDGRCGRNFRAPNGESAVCLSCDQGGCCNATGHCSQDYPCSCDTCVDYGYCSSCFFPAGCTYCSSSNVVKPAVGVVPNWRPSSSGPQRRPTARPRTSTSRPRPRPTARPRPKPSISSPWLGR